jgi:hypothetical protein
MPNFEEENQSIGLEDIIDPSDVLDAQGIDMSEYFTRIDQVFDSLDEQALSYTSAADFGAIVDQVMNEEATFLGSYLEINKSKPKTETVVVTAPRGRGLSFPRSLGWGGGAVSNLLTQNQKNGIRANLKRIFPGITDAEIDELVAQIQNSPTAMMSLARIGNIGYTTVGGVEKLTIRESQGRRIIGVLTSLNSPQSIRALNLMTGAIRAGRIRVVRG